MYYIAVIWPTIYMYIILFNSLVTHRKTKINIKRQRRWQWHQKYVGSYSSFPLVPIGLCVVPMLPDGYYARVSHVGNKHIFVCGAYEHLEHVLGTMCARLAMPLQTTVRKDPFWKYYELHMQSSRRILPARSRVPIWIRFECNNPIRLFAFSILLLDKA